MRVQITNGMFAALIMSMIFVKSVGFTQGIMARQVGGDFWLSAILAILQGILFMLIIVWVLRRAPNKNLIEHAGILLGKWIGKLIGSILFVFFIGAYTMMMITYTYHLMDYFLPEMPVMVFVVSGLALSVFGAYYGLEVISRMAFIGVFSIIVMNVTLLMGLIHKFDINELLPVFQEGIIKTAWVSRHFDADWAIVIMMAALILPNVKESKVWAKSGAFGIFYGGIFVVIWPMLEAGVMSPEVTGQYIISCMQLTRNASIGTYFHRYELGMVVFGLLPLVIELIVCLFCASLAASQTIGCRDYRPLIIPVAIILGGISYWGVLDHSRAITWMTYYWPPLALPIAFGLPLLLWVLGFLLKSRIRKNNGDV